MFRVWRRLIGRFWPPTSVHGYSHAESGEVGLSCRTDSYCSDESASAAQLKDVAYPAGSHALPFFLG
jgi:hypothetical protein